MNLTEISNAFITSSEYQKRFDKDINNHDFLKSIYKEVLQRKYDDDGFNYWLEKLNSEVESKDEVMIHFYNSTESINNYENELVSSNQILEQISLQMELELQLGLSLAELSESFKSCSILNPYFHSCPAVLVLQLTYFSNFSLRIYANP